MMRRIVIFELLLIVSVFIFSINILAEELTGDEAAGTYYGSLQTLYWSADDYETHTGQSSSTPVLAFPDPITLTFYKRGFTSETEFTLRAELNEDYYEDTDGLDVATDTSSVVRWHSETHAEYNLAAGSSPSFNFRWTDKEIQDHYVSIASSTFYDFGDNEYKVYFRATLSVKYSNNRLSVVSIQEGVLNRISDGVYYPGDGPYDSGSAVDPGDEPNEETQICNPLDTTGMLEVHAGVTYTYGNNVYRLNSDCSSGKIRRNHPFSVGDILYTGDGEKDMIEVSLGGGSSEFSSVGGEPFFRMQRLSVWQVLPDTSKANFRISRGKAMFRDIASKVKQLYSDEIIIETPSAVTSIRGTEVYYDVFDNGDSIIYVTHGEVIVKDMFDNEAILIAGQKVESSVLEGLLSIESITNEDYEIFEVFEIEEESNFIWGVILAVIIISPVVVVFLILRTIKRKILSKKK